MTSRDYCGAWISRLRAATAPRGLRVALRLAPLFRSSVPYMGLLPSFSTVVSQAVFLGAFVGLSKRAGLISVHPRAIKNDFARSSFEFFVNTSEWAIGSAESLLRAAGKK
jgi:hypothetical protein